MAKKRWFWPILQMTTKNVCFWPYLLHFPDFIKINKIWNSNLIHFRPLFFHTFPPVMNYIILVLLLLTCWPIFILGFGHKMEDSLRLNKDLFSPKVYLRPILKSAKFGSFWHESVVQTGKMDEHPRAHIECPTVGGGKAFMARPSRKEPFFAASLIYR